MRNSTAVRATAGGAIAMFALGISIFAAWVTHVVWVIKLLMSGAEPTMAQIALGVIGAIMPPIGVIHGFYLWFT